MEKEHFCVSYCRTIRNRIFIYNKIHYTERTEKEIEREEKKKIILLQILDRDMFIIRSKNKQTKIFQMK